MSPEPGSAGLGIVEPIAAEHRRMQVGDVYPLRQVNLVVSADAGGVLIALHLPDFVRMWNEGYDGRTGGATVVDVSVPDRASVDRLHAELSAAGHASPQEPSMRSSARVTQSSRTPTAISWV
jgi:hypothetical protein